MRCAALRSVCGGQCDALGESSVCCVVVAPVRMRADEERGEKRRERAHNATRTPQATRLPRPLLSPATSPAGTRAHPEESGPICQQSPCPRDGMRGSGLGREREWPSQARFIRSQVSATAGAAQAHAESYGDTARLMQAEGTLDMSAVTPLFPASATRTRTVHRASEHARLVQREKTLQSIVFLSLCACLLTRVSLLLSLLCVHCLCCRSAFVSLLSPLLSCPS